MLITYKPLSPRRDEIDLIRNSITKAFGSKPLIRITNLPTTATGGLGSLTPLLEAPAQLGCVEASSHRCPLAMLGVLPSPPHSQAPKPFCTLSCWHQNGQLAGESSCCPAARGLPHFRGQEKERPAPSSFCRTNSQRPPSGATAGC